MSFNNLFTQANTYALVAALCILAQCFCIGFYGYSRKLRAIADYLVYMIGVALVIDSLAISGSSRPYLVAINLAVLFLIVLVTNTVSQRYSFWESKQEMEQSK